MFPRMFNPAYSPARIPQGDFHVGCLAICNQTRCIHLKKIFVAYNAATPHQCRTFPDLARTQDAPCWLDPTFIDLTTLVVETSGSQVYAYPKTPYRGAIAAWGVHFGNNNPLNQARVLPHSYWDPRRGRSTKSACQGRIHDLERAEIWAIFQALVGIVKTFYAAEKAVGRLRPRHVIITTECFSAYRVLSWEITQWKNPQWRKDH